jgi:hypothetical protein
MPPGATPDERRRIGEVVHDDRGNASVRWQDAPADYERTKLELVSEAGPTPSAPQGCNPYEQPGLGTTQTQRNPWLRDEPTRRSRTDLRRLSEHIKRMRELEARKRDQED